MTINGTFRKNDFFKWASKLNFRKYAPHALKGQKLLAQGNALGNVGKNKVALFSAALKLLSSFSFVYSSAARLACSYTFCEYLRFENTGFRTLASDP